MPETATCRAMSHANSYSCSPGSQFLWLLRFKESTNYLVLIRHRDDLTNLSSGRIKYLRFDSVLHVAMLVISCRFSFTSRRGAR